MIKVVLMVSDNCLVRYTNTTDVQSGNIYVYMQFMYDAKSKSRFYLTHTFSNKQCES
jgi:hypothetical protein